MYLSDARLLAPYHYPAIGLTDTFARTVAGFRKSSCS